MTRLVIFADQPDWHTKRLVAALRNRGATAEVRSLKNCMFVLGNGGPGIAVPGFGTELPEAVLVRTIASGTFEQVTLRLSFLHALAMLGVPVINDARAIERCVDKSMTSFMLHRAGIPTPDTLVTEDDSSGRRRLAAARAEWVQKPLFGAQGRGLARLTPEDLPSSAEIYAGVHYLQRFVGRNDTWRDFRVMVVGGQPIAAMARYGQSWITNVRQGARCERIALSNRLADLSLAAVAAVGAHYAGVDLIEDHDGSLLVLEVNSMPAWKGLQSVAAFDIAARIADHVLDCIS